MFSLNLKIAWRNLWKNKSYTLINIFGLSIGLACCILIFIFIHYQLSFDRDYKNENRIFRFVTNWQYPNYNDFSKGIPIPLAVAARNELAGLDKVGVIIKRGGIIHVRDENGKDKIKTEHSVYYIEPDFFEIFDILWLYGSPQKSLTEPNTVVLSENMAKKLFSSTENSLGKSLTYGNKINLKVTGIFKDMPANSSFPLDIVISYATFNSKKYIYWDGINSAMECYVLLKEGVTLSDMSKPLARFNKKHYGDAHIAGKQNNSLQPLKDIHFDNRYGSFSDVSITKKEIYGLSIIGIFLILTAGINFINLTTAQTGNRSKEVGIRKIMGGQRKQIVVQFLAETLVITTIAMIIACVLTELALPQLQNLFNEKIVFSFFGQPVIFLFMAGLLILVSFLAGFYPALVLSGFSPVLALKNRISTNTDRLNLRRTLVVVQLTITVILLISTLVIVSQMDYLRRKPLGFNTKAIAMINIPSDSLSQTKYKTFKQQALGIAGIDMISFCQSAPMSDNVNSGEFSYNGRKNTNFELRNVKADENYFALFNLELIAGKIFRYSEITTGCVVNETFLKKMNITRAEDAIGKTLTTNGYDMKIEGVVKDFNDLSLKAPISPLVIYPQKGNYYAVAAKINSEQLLPVMKKIEVLWNNTFPSYIHSASFVNDDINSYYENERVTGVLFKTAAIVIILISFIGLFGLISFIAARRTREVAIRKVLGASTFEIISLLNSAFLKMVLVSNLIAWPLAYLFTSHWLTGFAYRISLDIWPFTLAFILSIAITLVTTILKSYKASTKNPVDALKHD
ncbi:ABC transporter permease [Pedobacter sp. HMWF019]|uniref:ABC transporter permease n=1 Tax=Pedobacter sp. HMWF019 TaxID=2056856 RepID=UPI000D39FDDD|nr:ABC transporter permease [Pedobacter sp. HMWF019]PTT01679.1 ABC transporter permease [Pedobacter sp. HMWF019]